MHNIHARRILSIVLSIAMAMPPTTAYAAESMVDEEAAYQNTVALVQDVEVAAGEPEDEAPAAEEPTAAAEEPTAAAEEPAAAAEEPAAAAANEAPAKAATGNEEMAADDESSDEDVALQTMGNDDVLTDFTSPNGDLTIDEANGTVLVTNNNDNHYAVYQGLNSKANAFVFEADAQLVDPTADTSAAILFGFSRKTAPGDGWYGANFDTYRTGDDAFRIFGPGFDYACANQGGVDFSQPVHLKLEVEASGAYKYSFGNTGTALRESTGTIPNWNGGYVGLLTWRSNAVFSNIHFTDNSQTVPDNTIPLQVDERFLTNLSNFTTLNGSWEVTSDGLHSNAVNKGDAFAYSATRANNFVYSTDVKFLSNEGAASLVFRSGSATNHKNSYAVNLDVGSKRCKFWRWSDGRDDQLINEKEVAPTVDKTYNLKVVAIDDWISYYVNGVLVASSGDYTLQVEDRGQDTGYNGGYFGLLNWNGDMVFQNTYFAPFTNDFDPTVNNIKVSANEGAVEAQAQFSPHEPIFIQYVGNDVKDVDLTVEPKNASNTVVVTDGEGTEYAEGTGVPVNVGKNYINVVSTATAEDGQTATLTYRVNVHRRQADAIYYNEPYRDQYHYSVKDGWGNDPNGLVYYKGTYHFFYQFYDDIRWGPMHWGHATSPDLVHWEEKPMALYPDANGAMFSGCIVADETNQSGLFSTSEGGLVALITCDGNGQRIKLAYSEDEGATWTKVRKIAADWTNDPLGNRDFRDPKVFRWEGKWFMVVAGGPLRIYSSPNLVDWTCESTYYDLHTECPDLYPIQASDGNIKWVLSRGGRKYKVGNFTQVNGKWTFVADEAYKFNNGSTDGLMNFGKDSYAAMTFYVQDFGTAAAPTLPDIIEINWMNTWEDYCNLVADKVGQAFNGTYNLALKEGLVKDGDNYVLTQTPVEAYETLRNTQDAIELTDATVATDNTLLDDFAGDCYEVLSTFRPGEGTTKVGFQLRVGEGEHTDVIYDFQNQTLSIDRSKSGTQISGRFSEVDSQAVTPNEDGSVTLHIFVDRASVEVFSKGYTVAGANQIFPGLGSLGIKAIAEGADAKADIAIYKLDSIWDKVTTNEPVSIQALTPAEHTLYAGKTAKLKVALLPISVAQDVTWSVDDQTIASVEGNGASATVTALKKGVATVTATSTVKPELSTSFKINVFEDNFQTNLDGFVNMGGNWFVDDITLHDENVSSNDFYMGKDPINSQEYTLSTKIKFSRGLPNIFFAANSTNPFDKCAYALQLNDSTHVRLFRFAMDGDLAIGEMGKQINDNQYHDILITKKADSVQVAVDGIQCIDYTFEATEEYYNGTPYVGLGLWDGAMDVQTLYVTLPTTDISAATVTAPDQTYTGEALEPTPTITLDGQELDPADFDVAYDANTHAGTATVTVTAREGGAYEGSASGSFAIAPAAITSVGAVADQTYTGSAIKPALTVRAGSIALAKADYDVAFANNVHAGTATATVTAKAGGDFSGSATAKFRIKPAAITSVGAVADQTYTGSAIKPALTVRAGSIALAKADYGVAFANNVHAGTATATVTAKAGGDFSGSATAKFRIKPASISGAAVAHISYRFYDGKPYEPDPAVTLGGKKLAKGTDYTLSYDNNVYASVSRGRNATVTATGKGDYTGSVTAEFVISKNYQPMTGRAVVRTAEFYPLQSADQVVEPPLVVAHAVSAAKPLEYSKKSGDACLSVDKATGKVTVKKGTKAGTYSIRIRAVAFGGANYNDGDVVADCTVKVADTRKANPMKVAAAAQAASAKALKTKAVAVAPVTVTGAKGKVAYKKASGSAQLSVDASTGKVTVKKGTKAGTYSAKVSVTAAGNATYKDATKTVTVKVTVK